MCSIDALVEQQLKVHLQQIITCFNYEVSTKNNQNTVLLFVTDWF